MNFGSCNFGLKSYLWFQIELVLGARSILKSRVWFQTKLHSTQFNYHSLSDIQMGWIHAWILMSSYNQLARVTSFKTRASSAVSYIQTWKMNADNLMLLNHWLHQIVFLYKIWQQSYWRFNKTCSSTFVPIILDSSVNYLAFKVTQCERKWNLLLSSSPALVNFWKLCFIRLSFIVLTKSFSLGVAEMKHNH